MEETIVTRDEMIDYVMTNHFNTDDAKFYDANLIFLQGMSDEELERLYDSIIN